VRQRAITTNFLLNILGAILPLATALATIPLYIDHIGTARYGILAIVWVLLGYFGVLDFGLSRASVNALSRLAHASPTERAPVLVTSLYANLVLGAVGGVILYIVSGALLPRFANLPGELEAETMRSMPWIAAMLPVALVSAIGSGALESRERFLASNVLQTFGGVIGQVAPVVSALVIAPTLTVVIPAAFFARLLSTLVIWTVVAWSERPVDFRRFDPGRLRELLGYGLWVTVSAGISPLMQSIDQVLIGAMLGPTATAHYSVPVNLASRGQLLALALVKTLFPRLSRLPPEDAKSLASRAFVTLAFGFGALCGPAIALAEPFLRLWVGADFASYATPVAQTVLVGAWTSGLSFIPYALMQGQGRPDLTAKIHAIEVLPFLAILYGLVVRFGLSGAAIAWSLRATTDCLLMLWYARCWSPYTVRLLPAVGMMAGCWLAAQVLPASLLVLLLAAALLGAAFLGLGLALDQEMQKGARAIIRHIRQRVAHAVPHTTLVSESSSARDDL
jgi:O-antigen/teichoic acid export membrane protein